MSDCTELDIYFTSSNPNPTQELQGIITNHWDAFRLIHIRANRYQVGIFELSLLECLGIVNNIQEHCIKNGREVEFVVTYGVIHHCYLPALLKKKR